MSLGKNTCWIVLSALLCVSTGCSKSSSGGGNTILSAVQDLGLDPDGLTTVITFSKAPGALTVANFEADGGQTAQTVAVVAAVATVGWDQRVTPSHGVRGADISGASVTYVGVTTSDTTAPGFSITDAQQNSGGVLGGDTIEVTFAGPRVVPTNAADVANWDLQVNAQSLDLTGSTFVFDTVTQTLDITLGPDANLYPAFTLAVSSLTSVADVAVSGTAVVGAATGDAVVPALISADQNIDDMSGGDEYGRIVEFTFDKAMDPASSTGLARFGVPLPAIATSAQQITDTTLRVTFSSPVVPGVDTVTLTGLVDAHGNAFPGGAQAIAQPSPFANLFDGAPTANTIENSLNDTIVVPTLQAFDPDSAEDPASWTINVDGNPVVVSDQTLTYDFLGKMLTIELDFDMQNGVGFDIAGNNVLEVDGQTFSQLFIGAVAGDTGAPTALSVLQNRTTDNTGRTIDVQMSEDVDAVEAEDEANWAVAGGITVITATLLPSLDVVRLTLDAPAVPGDATVALDAIEDLAGNAMAAPQSGVAITSTDSTPPTITAAAAEAVEGADNDTLEVTFDDDMVSSEVVDASNWTVETPVGTPVSTTGATATYDSVSRVGTLTFEAATGVNFERGDDFSVTLNGARDISGNTITAGSQSGPVAAETNLPEVHTIARDGVMADQVSVRFSEPCGQLTDLYDAATNPTGTRYVLREAGGVQRALGTTAGIEDGGLGVRVGFGIVVDPTDTVDVLGVEDLAGNPMFPALTVAIVPEDLVQPSLDAGLSTLVTVSGERNDVITVTFDRSMSPWDLLDPRHYTLDSGGPIDLSAAEFSFDGDRVVTIDLDPVDLQTLTAYDLSVNDVRTAQGVLRSIADTEIGIVASGDATLPNLLVGLARLDPNDSDSLLIDVDEALNVTDAETAPNYDYNGSLADSATRIGPRTVRATFSLSPPTVGGNLDVTLTDLAGNTSALISRLVTAADGVNPLVTSVSGTAVPNTGGDFVSFGFNEAVDTDVALDLSRYAVHNNGGFMSFTGATAEYDSVNQMVRLYFADGQELNVNSAITVTMFSIPDYSGNASASPVVLGGAIGGDMTPPSIVASFVNLREGPGSTTVDVLFDEDVDSSFVEEETNWSVSGGQTVTSAVLVNPDFVRLQLGAAVVPGETIDVLAGLSDRAGNAALALNDTPTH